MYFNAETQARILRHFHFALRDGGVLMLGRSEMMLSHRDLFSAVDLEQRIFARRPHEAAQGRVSALANGEPPRPREDDRESRDAALELAPQAQVIVSRAGTLTFANLAARALLNIPLDDLGRPLAELAVAQKPVDLLAAWA